jgi:hypothetical protein
MADDRTLSVDSVTRDRAGVHLGPVLPSPLRALAAAGIMATELHGSAA